MRGDPGISNLVLFFLFVSVKDLSIDLAKSLTNHTH